MRLPAMVGKSGKQSTLFDDDFGCDAVPSEKTIGTSSAFYLRAKGRLGIVFV